MTTAAMVVAMVPLLIAKGAGAASRFDIGVVIAAGMTIGTIFTLFVTPAVYTFLAKDYQKARARAAEHDRPAAPEAAVPSPIAAAPIVATSHDPQAIADALAHVAGETPGEEGHSTEVLAFSSAAAAASPGPETGRKGRRKWPRRKPLTPAAE
jgi:H+/gluconate symporter-like permease